MVHIKLLTHIIVTDYYYCYACSYGISRELGNCPWKEGKQEEVDCG
jgi:hypothetical protein